MTPADLCARVADMLAALETTIVGKRDALHLLLAAILADGHVLIEDVPGVAKTSIARAVAQILGGVSAMSSARRNGAATCVRQRTAPIRRSARP